MRYALFRLKNVILEDILFYIYIKGAVDVLSWSNLMAVPFSLCYLYIFVTYRYFYEAKCQIE